MCTLCYCKILFCNFQAQASLQHKHISLVFYFKIVYHEYIFSIYYDSKRYMSKVLGFQILQGGKSCPKIRRKDRRENSVHKPVQVHRCTELPVGLLLARGETAVAPLTQRYPYQQDNKNSTKKYLSLEQPVAIQIGLPIARLTYQVFGVPHRIFTLILVFGFISNCYLNNWIRIGYTGFFMIEVEFIQKGENAIYTSSIEDLDSFST